MGAALKAVSSPLRYFSNGEEHLITDNSLISNHGDVVLGRKDIDTAAYVLASVIDDAAQGITEVIRGTDLCEITQVQVLLQHLLDLPTPNYHHHRLIRDEQGKRLAKRHDARALSKYRDAGATPQDIRRLVGL